MSHVWECVLFLSAGGPSFDKSGYCIEAMPSAVGFLYTSTMPIHATVGWGLFLAPDPPTAMQTDFYCDGHAAVLVESPCPSGVVCVVDCCILCVSHSRRRTCRPHFLCRGVTRKGLRDGNLISGPTIPSRSSGDYIATPVWYMVSSRAMREVLLDISIYTSHR